DKNYAALTHVKQSKAENKEIFNAEARAKLKEAVGTVPYADYILCMIFTGFRTSEFLDLTAGDYDPINNCLTGGAKTEAGENRVITISPIIKPVIERLVKNKLPGAPLFHNDDGKKFTYKRFREQAFNPVLEALNINSLTPHCTRHTFATMMKDIAAPITDKQGLMGHASAEMTYYYTHTDIESLRRITDNLQ
ncbi:MAG: tyrosine-type recombinase/integrase, partial [Oscillospiraceae bacterium]|nr:tyrosine-type recombinase/integrase [Oscillospiraceae bacterium]